MPSYTQAIMRTHILVLVLATFLLGACAVNPAGRSSFTGLMSRSEEMKVGAEEHPKILEQFGGVYDDPVLGDYIRRIGNEIVSVSEEKGLPFTFTILNSDTVNAFALPGGYVYITRALLVLSETEAEVASVLAHEIGHVTARHTAERYSQTVAAQFGLSILGAIGSAYGVPGSVGNMASVGAQAVLRGYSRDQELEADLLGIRYMTHVGYDPEGSVGFFRKLKAHTDLVSRMSGDGDADARTSIMSTHPRTTDRIEKAIELAAAAPAGGVPRIEGDTYLRHIDGIIYGDDPDEGVRQGRTFIHPGLRIRFEVPEGFTLFNTPTQVTAVSRDKSIIAYDMVEKGKAKAVDDLRSYLSRQWAPNVNIVDLEEIEINGMKAATGRGRTRMKDGVRDLRLVVILEKWGSIHRLAFITDPANTDALLEPFRRTTYSFRTLTDAEVRAVAPLHVRLHTAQAGDTVEGLAGSLPFASEADNQALFRIINGLAQGERPLPGSLVKQIR